MVAKQGRYNSLSSLQPSWFLFPAGGNGTWSVVSRHRLFCTLVSQSCTQLHRRPRKKGNHCEILLSPKRLERSSDTLALRSQGNGTSHISGVGGGSAQSRQLNYLAHHLQSWGRAIFHLGRSSSEKYYKAHTWEKFKSTHREKFKSTHRAAITTSCKVKVACPALPHLKICQSQLKLDEDIWPSSSLIIGWL